MSTAMKAILGTVAGLFIVSLLLPTQWGHGIVYGIVTNVFPIIADLMIIVGIIVVCAALFADAGKKAGWIGFGVFVLGVIFWTVSVNAYWSAMAYSFNPEEITQSQLGDTTIPRYITFEIAAQDFKGQQNDPTKQTGDIDPLLTNGEIDWVGPVIPNGFGNQIGATTTSLGVIHPDDKVKFAENSSFACAENGVLNSGVYWKLYSADYLAEYPEIFYFQYNGQWMMVAPIEKPVFHFPIFYEDWGGDVVLDSHCNAQVLSPLQAMADPRLKGANIFPADLARKRAEAWGYRFGGLLNQLIFHRQQVEIPDMPYTDNQQPFFMNTKMGNMWMIAAEPHGTSLAVFKTFFFNTSSGAGYTITLNENNSMIGPVLGATYVQGKTPGYTWVTSNDSGSQGTYIVLEPRPLIHDGIWFWMYTISTYSTDKRGKYGGTALVALLNGGNKDDVRHFCTISSFDNWLHNAGQPDSLPCGNTTGASASASTQLPTPSFVPTVTPMPVVTGQVPSDLENMTNQQLWDLIHQAMQILENRTNK